MTLTELKYCLELQKTKNFGQAAKNVFVSQPTLSIAIKKIEQELNICIFERKKNTVLITDVGEKILLIAKSIMLNIESIKQLANNENEEFSTIKIGAIYTIAPYFFSKMIEIFNEIIPNIKLSIEENYTSVLIEKLNSGELDIIIIAETLKNTDITTAILYKEPFVLAVSTKHKFAKYKSIDLEEIKNETLLLLGNKHCFREQILAVYPKLSKYDQRHKLQKTLEGTSLETIRYTVAANNGITILPCTAIQKNQNMLAYIPLKEPIPIRTVVVGYRKSFSKQKILQLILNSLQNIYLPCTYKIDKILK